MPSLLDRANFLHQLAYFQPPCHPSPYSVAPCSTITCQHRFTYLPADLLCSAQCSLKKFAYPSCVLPLPSLNLSLVILALFVAVSEQKWCAYTYGGGISLWWHSLLGTLLLSSLSNFASVYRLWNRLITRRKFLLVAVISKKWCAHTCGSSISTGIDDFLLGDSLPMSWALVGSFVRDLVVYSACGVHFTGCWSKIPATADWFVSLSIDSPLSSFTICWWLKIWNYISNLLGRSSISYRYVGSPDSSEGSDWFHIVDISLLKLSSEV